MSHQSPDEKVTAAGGPSIVILGTAQDAGYPSAGCNRPCCAAARADSTLTSYAACLGIVDPASGQRWLIDCTPDFREQLHLLDQKAPWLAGSGLSGILLTHAHIGHYLGLAQLGREVMDTAGLPLYAMPRMAGFLGTNQPWAQLIELGQVSPIELKDCVSVSLCDGISVTPVQVPHRGEFSETVGYLISGPRRTVFYLPDIDGWEDCADRILKLVDTADLLLVDGTFFSEDELPGRDMSEIPHPTILQSMEFFGGLPEAERGKVHFIHFNHTNPVLDPSSSESKHVEQAGFRLARQGMCLRI